MRKKIITVRRMKNLILIPDGEQDENFLTKNILLITVHQILDLLEATIIEDHDAIDRRGTNTCHFSIQSAYITQQKDLQPFER